LNQQPVSRSDRRLRLGARRKHSQCDGDDEQQRSGRRGQARRQLFDCYSPLDLNGYDKPGLARLKRLCIGSTRAESRSILIGTHAHLRLERSGEVTLIEEPRG
jgi:hypothetical protein